MLNLLQVEHEVIIQVIDFGSSLYRFSGFWLTYIVKLLHEQFRLLLK